MRIAVTTQQPETITGHAGRCRRFTVFQAEGGQVTGKHVVEIADEQTLHHSHVLPLALGRLDAFITGGMGEGLFARLEASQIRPVITAERSPDAAVAAFLAGTLVSGAPHSHGPGHHH